jgi:hypothetical protein
VKDVLWVRTTGAERRLIWREGTLKELAPRSFKEWLVVALIIIHAIILLLINLLFFWPIW